MERCPAGWGWFKAQVESGCRVCAGGCGQKVFVKDERVIGIEGDPDSPISRGRLCPKGASSEQLVNNPLRQTKVRYRAPYATDWQDLDLSLIHISEPTRPYSISNAVFCLKKKEWNSLFSN